MVLIWYVATLALALEGRDQSFDCHLAAAVHSK